MSGKFYIAEKRDLAEKLAPCVAAIYGGTVEQKDGWIQVGENAVSWFRGHMYESAKPQAYGYQFGDLKNMPVIVPDGAWQMEIREDKYNWYVKQVKLIRSLLPNYSMIVNVGDAEREGQLLIDEALIQWGIDPFGPNILRLWSDDLTAPKLTAAIKSQFPNAEKKTLYEAAITRSYIDYEWGMTFTGMFTEFVRMGTGNKQLISIGRLQMAMTRIVANRDKERREFRPTDHFLPSAKCSHSNVDFKAKWQWGENTPLDSMGRLTDRSVVQNLVTKIAGKQGRVDGFSRDPKETAPPLTYHLSAVTSELASKHGFSSDKTLALASKLYLDELSSYPRGDSRYLTNGVRQEIPQIFENLKDIPEFSDILKDVDLNIKTACWNDSKVKDHYALVPTTQLTLDKWNGLTADEKTFLYTTTRQLIAQFYPNMKYDAIGANLSCEGEKFRATGRVVKSLGWKSIFKEPSDNDEDSDDVVSLPEMKIGDAVDMKDIDFGATTTKIPPRLNDGTLNDLLEAPASLVTDPALKRKMRETDGIGRPSTRVPTLKLLFERGYLKRPAPEKGKRKKKTDDIEVETTDLGYDLINTLPEELKSIGMTAIWEGRLENIKNGEETRIEFMEEIHSELKRLTDTFIDQYGKDGLKLKGVSIREPMPGDGELCSKCGVGHMKTIHFPSKKEKGVMKRALVCDQGRDKCDNVVFEDTRPPVVPLPKDGEICPKCGVGHLKTIQYEPKNKKGTLARALVCDQGRDKCSFIEGENTVKPMDGDGEICPKCGVGHLKTIEFPSKTDKKVMKRALVCDQGREKCQFVKFDEAPVKPMKGDGEICPKCGIGHMKTVEVPSKKKPGTKVRFLACDQGRDKCDSVIFEDTRPPVKPLPGDGELCSKCGVGHMKTIQVPSKKKPGTMTVFLACDQGRDKCDNVKFVDSEPPPKPLPGDGKVCPKCGVGHMRTKAIPSTKKPGTKFIALACDNRSCKELEFPKG